MAGPVNPTTVTWINPTVNKDNNPYGQANNAGYQVTLDGQPVVSVPLAWGTSFDLTQLNAFKALKSGAHSLVWQCVSKGGVASLPSSAAPFSVEAPALAPTAVTLA